MTNEQIKQIEEILTGYKFLGTSRSIGDCYIFQNLYRSEFHIEFITDIQIWYFYEICNNRKLTACVTSERTRQINKIINDVLGWE